jgi:YHS domain-containing protein
MHKKLNQIPFDKPLSKFYICKGSYYICIYANRIMAKDPVCNMNVDEKTAKYTSEINGDKIYLCSSACKQQFDQNPSKYGH